jgi:hypothetical protein
MFGNATTFYGLVPTAHPGLRQVFQHKPKQILLPIGLVTLQLLHLSPVPGIVDDYVKSCDVVGILHDLVSASNKLDKTDIGRT